MAELDVRINESLRRSVYESYPSPLADPYVKLIREIRRLKPNWEAAYGRYLDCFEISVRFMALVATAACLKNGRPTPQGDAARRIRELIDKPKVSTGDWFGLLRETLKTLQTGSDCASLLAREYYSKGGKQGELADMLNQIPNLRNRTRGHGVTLETVEYRRLLVEEFGNLEAWYKALGFFSRHSLVTCLQCERDQSTGEYHLEVELRQGSRRYYPTERRTSSSQMTPFCLYLIEDQASGQIIEADQIIELYPLLVYYWNAEDAESDVVLFAKNEKSCLNYDCPRTGAAYTDALLLEDAKKSDGDQVGLTVSAQQDFEAALRAVFPSSDLPGRFRRDFFDEYAKKVRHHSSSVLERLKAQRLYEPNSYVERRKMNEHLASFMATNVNRAFVIGGPSGSGKTSYLCNFVAQQLANEDNPVMPLLLTSESFSEGDVSIENAVCSALGCASLASWLAQANRHPQAIGKWDLVVVIDGLDKHPSVPRMIEAVDHWVRRTDGETGVRLVASCNSTGLDLASKEIAAMKYELYFTPARRLLAAGADDAPELPAVEMPPFTDEELSEAYERYREIPGCQPTTLFAELEKNRAAVSVMRHPLFMRLAVEAYNRTEIPQNPISFQTLNIYCNRHIFAHPDRRAFVEALVDRMLEQKERELRASQMIDSPALRKAYLNGDGSSPFKRLLDDQVLVVNSRPVSAFPVEIEEASIGFSIDRVFQFLLILRAIHKFGGSLESLVHGGLEAMARYAADYPSLRAGIGDLVLDIAGDTKRKIYGNWEILSKACHLAETGVCEWMTGVFRDVFVTLAAGEGGEQDEAEKSLVYEQRSPFEALRQFFLDHHLQLSIPLFFSVVDVLFERGLWRSAEILLVKLAESDGLPPGDLYRAYNRLVVCLKNSDEWERAEEYSDKADALLLTMEDVKPQVLAQHKLNRFSVLYDRGRRDEALALCEESHRIAEAHRLDLEFAASGNNLGIAYVYFDQGSKAERVLTEAIDAAVGGPSRAAVRGSQRDARYVRIAGHCYLDRSLVTMIRWQLGRGGDLAASERDAKEAFSRFQKLEYLQGVLYARASLGLIRFYEGRLKLEESRSSDEDEATRASEAADKLFQEALELMERSLAEAEELGEAWPTYGAKTNLALFHLRCSKPNPERAVQYAAEAYREVVDNADPEGIGLISMVLARILLDLDESSAPLAEALRTLQKGDLAETARSLLEGSRDQLETLGFRSAATLAAAGLIEVAERFGLNATLHQDERDRLRAGLSPDEFPADFGNRFEPVDWKFLFLAELL